MGPGTTLASRVTAAGTRRARARHAGCLPGPARGAVHRAHHHHSHTTNDARYNATRGVVQLSISSAMYSAAGRVLWGCGELTKSAFTRCSRPPAPAHLPLRELHLQDADHTRGWQHLRLGVVALRPPLLVVLCGSAGSAVSAPSPLIPCCFASMAARSAAHAGCVKPRPAPHITNIHRTPCRTPAP